MIDLKKLVTGFLLLAFLVGSLSFIFSSYAPTVTTSDDITQINFPSKEPPPFPVNAFVEPVPEAKPQLQSENIIAANETEPAPSPSNLTAALTQNLIGNIIEANPEGPVKDGQLNLAEPDLDVMIKNFTQSPAAQKFKIPDWEKEANSLEVAVIENPSEEDLSHYNIVLQDLTEKLVRGDILVTSGQENFSEDKLLTNLASTGDIVKYVFETAKATQAPKQFADLHKSGVKLFFLTHKILELAQNMQDDPLGASFIIEAQLKNINAATQDFQSEYMKAQKSGVISGNKNASGVLAAVNNVLGIKIAHAQYLTSTVFDAPRTIHDIIEELKRTLIAVLKQVVVKKILNDIVSFVQGNGKPLFITNWKSFLEDTYKTLAGAAIGVVVPGLCRPFQPLIRINLQNTFVNGINGSLSGSCSLDQIVANIQGFYINFQNGGWIAYGQVTLPSGNYFGNLILTNEEIDRQARQGTNAAKNEGIASGGFLSVKQCPSGTTSVQNNSSLCAVNGSNGQMFLDATHVTPGSAIAGKLMSGFNKAGEGVTSANDSWASLFTAFIGQVIDSLISRGLKNLLGAVKF